MFRRPVPKWQNLDSRAAAEGILSHPASLTHWKTLPTEKGKNPLFLGQEQQPLPLESLRQLTWRGSTLVLLPKRSMVQWNLIDRMEN